MEGKSRGGVKNCVERLEGATFLRKGESDGGYGEGRLDSCSLFFGLVASNVGGWQQAGSAKRY